MRRAGLFLRDTTGRSQRETLLGVLQYLGGHGLNTLEGVDLGFYRIATRVQELQEAGYSIDSCPERVEGPDGLVQLRPLRPPAGCAGKTGSGRMIAIVQVHAGDRPTQRARPEHHPAIHQTQAIQQGAVARQLTELKGKALAALRELARACAPAASPPGRGRRHRPGRHCDAVVVLRVSAGQLYPP